MATDAWTHWAVLEMAEEAAPGSTIDLWPRVAARMAVKPRRTAGPNLSRKRVQLAVGLGLLLLLAGSLVFAPAARAFAEDIIQRMGIALVDTQQFDPNTRVESADRIINPSPPPSLSLDEIRAQINFPLRLPAWLPEGLDYTHNSIHTYDPQSWAGSGKKVGVDYGRTPDFDFASGVLQLGANDGPISAPPLLAESREQEVTVNGQPGIYVHGGWQDDGRGDPNTRLGPLLWDDRADDAYLTWTQDGVTYLLEAHNLGLELADMQRIAASMVGE